MWLACVILIFFFFHFCPHFSCVGFKGGHGSGRGGYWRSSHLPRTLRVLEIQTHHPKHNDNIRAGLGVAGWGRSGQVWRVGFSFPHILSFLSSADFFTSLSSFFSSFLLLWFLLYFRFISSKVTQPQHQNPWIKPTPKNLELNLDQELEISWEREKKNLSRGLEVGAT